MISRPLLTLPLLGLLVGCVSTDPYPSLLPRAAEKQSFAEPDLPSPAAAAPDPALDARIATALKTLDERIAAFDAIASRAATQVARARGAAAGSESWLDAQVMLAELDSARSATLEVTTDLDDAASERAVALAPDYPTLDEAVAKARAAAEAQAKRIADLQGTLASA